MGPGKATTGIVARWCGVPLLYLSRTQTMPTLSTAEAELQAINQGGREGKYLSQVLEDVLGKKVGITLKTDSSAAIDFCTKVGPSKMRHIERQQLWIQHQLEQEKMVLEKIGTEVNSADALTKAVSSAEQMRDF